MNDDDEDISVEKFLSSIEESKRQLDSRKLVELMEDATGVSPKMWGTIIGFGSHHYKYDTGREGDTIAVGFSPRKAALVIYGVVYYDQNSEEVTKLGKYKLGKGCLYVGKLDDVDTTLLKEMTTRAFNLRNNV